MAWKKTYAGENRGIDAKDDAGPAGRKGPTLCAKARKINQRAIRAAIDQTIMDPEADGAREVRIAQK